MKGTQHPKNDVSLNASGNPSILDVIDRVDVSRRNFVRGGVSASALAAAGGLSLGGLVQTVQATPASTLTQSIGFANVPANTRALNVSMGGVANAVIDKITVPAGYTAKLLVAWGDPIMPGGTAFVGDASESSAQQAKQFGMHTDGMHIFPMQGAGGAVLSDRGVLCANNEYTHEAILFTNGQELATNYTVDKTRKSQNAHGVSICEVRRVGGNWQVVKNSPFGRRITANTPCKISGPAAGHALMKTNKYVVTADRHHRVPATSPTARPATARSTTAPMAITPWGTYLTCEENFNGNFGSDLRGRHLAGHRGRQAEQPLWRQRGRLRLPLAQNRPALRRGHEPERAAPVRLGGRDRPRQPDSHAGQAHRAGPLQARERAVRGRHAKPQVAFYMGDDERNEYIYKFVCAGKFNRSNRAANRNLLDSGTLYVARFNADLTGAVDRPGAGHHRCGRCGAARQPELRRRQRCRGAGQDPDQDPHGRRRRRRHDDGPPRVDRCAPAHRRLRRGRGLLHADQQQPPRQQRHAVVERRRRHHRVPARPARRSTPPTRAPDNVYGHIIRWRETGKTVTATTLRLGPVRAGRRHRHGQGRQAAPTTTRATSSDDAERQRRLRCAGRPVVRPIRPPVGADRPGRRRLGRLRQHRRQHDGVCRPEHR